MATLDCIVVCESLTIPSITGDQYGQQGLIAVLRTMVIGSVLMVMGQHLDIPCCKLPRRCDCSGGLQGGESGRIQEVMLLIVVVSPLSMTKASRRRGCLCRVQYASEKGDRALKPIRSFLFPATTDADNRIHSSSLPLFPPVVSGSL